MRRSGLLRALAIASVSGVCSCAFGGLAEYEIDQCNPEHTTQKDDACDRLNRDEPTTCMPKQCSEERRCVAKLRDDDRDGDPPTSCGGTDCDDSDPQNSGKGQEKCDGRDNDCNGQVDEGVIVGVAPTDVTSNADLPGRPDPTVVTTNGASPIGAYVAKFGTTGQCIAAVHLDNPSDGALSTQGCTFLTDDGDPANATTREPVQPMVRVLEGENYGGAAAAFVTLSACPTGEASYRWVASQRAVGSADVGCATAQTMGGGAALPSIAEFPGGTGVLVTWYGVPAGSRGDPVASCANAPAGTLYGSIITAPADPDPNHAMPSPFPIATGAVSMRPAATLPLPSLGGILVATPTGSDVSVSLVRVGKNAASPAVASVPALQDARSVALAAKSTGGTTRVALVAELGCTPQKIRAVFGDLDPTSGAIAFGQPVDVVQGGSSFVTAPSVAWVSGVAGRNEWVISWVADGPIVRARRFDESGGSLGDAAIDVASGAVVSASASDGSLYTFQAAGRFQRVPLGCGS